MGSGIHCRVFPLIKLAKKLKEEEFWSMAQNASILEFPLIKLAKKLKGGGSGMVNGISAVSIN